VRSPVGATHYFGEAMSAPFECPNCKYDFDADRGAICWHCDRPDPDAMEIFRARIRSRLRFICEDAKAGGLTKLDLEHLVTDTWPE
jgi:hypothetical protein